MNTAEQYAAAKARGVTGPEMLANIDSRIDQKCEAIAKGAKGFGVYRHLPSLFAEVEALQITRAELVDLIMESAR